MRPEIQALRAAAVLLVVVHHLWPPALPGGFVGVDVFFLISGFLITSHLLREIDRTGRVSLPEFWARRARRILPAALFVVLCCAVATILVVPQNHWPQFLAEMQASTAYVQNWQLAGDAVDYFAAENAPSPVQHFWSLSAEEQFYLGWPVLLVIALGVTRGHGARVRRGAIGVVVATLTLASLAYSIHATTANPAAAYFVTPARAWEFGAGGLLALLRPADGVSVAVRSALSWAGLTAIAVAALTYSELTPFPGSAALVPTLGALAVVWAGAPAGRWAPTPILSLPPVQFVGGISYSVYLWHLPLLVLAPFVVEGEVHTPTRITILMLILVAAWLTKLLVEDPLRSGRFLTRRSARWTFALAAAGSALVMTVTAGGTSHLQAQVRAAERASQRVLAERPACFGAAARDPERPCGNRRLRFAVVPTPLEARDRSNAPCTLDERRGLLYVCAFGVARSRAAGTIALIGDSHASHWRAAVEVVARAKRWRGLSITHTGCPLTRAPKAFRDPAPGPDCRQWNREVLGWLREHPEVSTVFVSSISGSSWVAPRGQSQFATAVAGYARAYEALPASERVIVIRDTPKAEGDTAACVQRALARRRRAAVACALSRARALDADPAAAAATRLAPGRTHVVDLTRFACDRRTCFPVVGGALVHKDEHHITTVFATTLGPYLLRRVEALPGG